MLDLNENCTDENCCELRNVGPKGKGIFATRTIRSGEVVITGVVKEQLSENHSHAAQVAIDRYVIFEGLIQYVNHSCEPNCGLSINEMGGHDFVARKNIEAGQEVTFDYAMRNYSVEHFPTTCQCGAPECRGMITGWKDLPEERKRDYEGFVAPYLLELDKAKMAV